MIAINWQQIVFSNESFIFGRSQSFEVNLNVKGDSFRLSVTGHCYIDEIHIIDKASV